MPRPFRFPGYPMKPHKSGHARIRLAGRDVYLGAFGSAESRQRYAQLAAEFAAAPEKAILPPPAAVSGMTVADLVAAWLSAHTGTDQETREMQRALTVLVRVYGHTSGAEFAADQLEVVRGAMVSGSWMDEQERAKRLARRQPIGWCLSQTNHAISRVKRAFRWMELKRLVPRGTWNHLRTLPPLGRNDDARRTKPRQAPREETIGKILPELTPMVAAMLRIEMLTGMRPAELCRMREDEISEDGPEGCWLYTMGEDDHKTGHIDGQEGIVVLGPQSQAILRPFLELARLRGAGSAIWCPRPSTSEHYTGAGYYRAIVRACDRAKLPRITPYQLRHFCKAKIKRDFGLDGARAVLRHKTVAMTERYDRGVDIALAARIAKEAG